MKKYTFSTVIWGGEGGLSCQFFSIKKSRNVQKLSYSLQHILYFWNPIGMSLTGFIFFFVVTNCWDCNITTELFLLHLYLKLHLKCFTGFCIRLWFRLLTIAYLQFYDFLRFSWSDLKNIQNGLGRSSQLMKTFRKFTDH